MATIKVKNNEGNWENVAIATQMEVEPIILTGNQTYGCSGIVASNYIKLFGDTITTKDVITIDNMFNRYSLEFVPFEINMDTISSSHSANNMFSNCSQLKELPKINNFKPSNLNNSIYYCNLLREIPEDWGDTWNWDYIHSYQYGMFASFFMACYSLRRIPENFIKNFYGKMSYYSQPYSSMLYQCFTLDEINKIGVSTEVVITTNMFANTFASCCRLKNITFDVNEDGTAKIAQWKAQTIDLENVGFVATKSWITYLVNYNSGITADKEVTNLETYQALKDDPDWFSCNNSFSRYNHDSAVTTINSLPDTSAYLATAGGTNTIKFKGISGELTDGGAINTLTEEEIAVATAKGWTVSLV